VAALALVAAGAAAVAVVPPVIGAGESAVRAAAAAWDGVFGQRPQPAAEGRMIVLLGAPSLAERMAQAQTPPSAEDQRRWVAEAEASQRLLVARLAERGLRVDRVRSFTRTLNGFSAVLDARATAELGRMDGIAGVYPVRTLYPAALTAEVLTGAQFRAGVGRRPELRLAGYDGSGMRIGLLDGGVALDHPSLAGKLARGYDLVDRDRLPEAEAKPDEPAVVETHGTRMAGLLVGDGGPAGLEGVAPGAQLLPIRILGWERAADGDYALFGYGDDLLAGFERAVDPDGDGATEDALPVALAAVVEPYASFPDSPESRAVAGAARLGTLVVAAAGNDGRAGRGFGTVGAPGGAPAALTVGASDSRTETIESSVRLSVDGDEILSEPLPVLGSLPPGGALPVAALGGPSLAEPARAGDDVADGSVLADYFDAQGVSRVAGRAALVPGGGPLEARIRNAVAAGATAVVVAGGDAAPGSLDLDETTAVPVLSLPAEAGRAAFDALADGEPVSVAFEDARLVPNATAGEVAPFSSGGMAFGGHVKPDVVAPGIGIATTDAGTDADGSARYATATGSSVSAALVAGSAAALLQARPGLSAGELRSLLVGSARQIVADGETLPVTVQGTGVVDPAAAAAAELAVEPVTLAFGRAAGDAWRVTQTVGIRNLSTRDLQLGFGLARDRVGGPELSFAATPSSLALRAGGAAEVTLVASGTGPLEGEAGGAFVVQPEGSRPVRVPWAVSFRDEAPPGLLDEVSLSVEEFRASDASPAVLTFLAGGVVSEADGQAVEPVQLLTAELWTAKGRRIGVLARMHDLLPGRYAVGVTGRDPAGKVLGPGRYVIRLLAQPPAGDVGAQVTVRDVPFRLLRR
jgi:subtilisin family serine protease